MLFYEKSLYSVFRSRNMTREEAFTEINEIQDFYINELINRLNTPDYSMMKTINFTSPTGTGKTKMMSKLINKLPEYYFVITTLSKGQLHLQIKENLKKDCEHQNYTVYGSADYKINSRLDAEEIIGKIPQNTKCIWLRDEGHIRTNRYDELLLDKCFKVINFSATNTHSDIVCNFTQTMMLRTVNQTTGTPEDAIEKLLEIKEAHKNVPNYNPCAIFRCVSNASWLYDKIIKLCERKKLKYIDITEENYIMSELCEDDNEYDIIINKFKLVEGIDIKRAHILYMDNQPQNDATTIQSIGRCRRNALLYRDDIDIFAAENELLLKETRECYVYYNVEKMEILTDNTGELQMEFCNHVSCEELKPNTIIEVINGQMPNGLYILELENKTGKYKITVDKNTGYNIVNPITDFYETITEKYNNYIYAALFPKKININKINLLPLSNEKSYFDYDTGEEKTAEGKPIYILELYRDALSIKHSISEEIIDLFNKYAKKYTKDFVQKTYKNRCFNTLLDKIKAQTYSKKHINNYIKSFIRQNETQKGMTYFIKMLSKIEKNFKFDFTNDDNEVFPLVQYYCIKLKEERMINEDILGTYNSFISHLTELINTYKALFPHLITPEQVIKLVHLAFEYKDDFPKIHDINKEFNDFPKFIITIPFDGQVKVCDDDIREYFDKVKSFLASFETGYIDGWIHLYNQIEYHIGKVIDSLGANRIPCVRYSYESLYENLSEKEEYYRKACFVKTYWHISLDEIKKYKVYNYIKTINDKESALIGVDLMQQIRLENNSVCWIEAKSVSSKVGNHNKFNSYLTRNYSKELLQAKSQCFSGRNSFDLDKRCNSIIGYCVEYYSKFLVYGEKYLEQYIIKAKYESDGFEKPITDYIIIRACMLKYKEMMVTTFGKGVARIIKGITTQELIKDKYRYFVELVIELGKRTADFVKEVLYKDVVAKDDVDPNLSIKHIAGLADYITKDTILDVKVRNNIDEICVRQVLAYHYLSTKRSDLHIRRVIVYDAVSNKSVTVDIDALNINT